MSFASENGHKPIEIWLGPYRAGKTSRLISELVDYHRANPFKTSHIVVPSARYGRLIEGRLVANLGKTPAGNEQGSVPGVFGLTVMSFYRVCQLVLQAAGRPCLLVADGVRAALVGQVIRQLSDRGALSGLAPIAQLPGTHAAVLSLIDEFQRAGLSPEEVLAKLGEATAIDSRFRELARIYDGYWQKLTTVKRLDKKGLAFVARQILLSEDLDQLDFGWLVVDGFDRISRLQAQVIAGLSRLAQRTTVLFDYAGHNEDEPPLEYQWKLSSYRELLNTLKPDSVLPFFSAEHVPAARHSFNALDRFLEMDEIARRCKDSIASGGLKAGDILVSARDIAVYRHAAQAAFKNAGVPYFLDDSVKLTDLPLSRVVLTLLHLKEEEFPRKGVLDFLSSCYANLPRLGLTYEHVRELDRLSIGNRLVCGRARWERLVRESGADERLKSGLVRFFDMVAPPAAAHPASEFCAWVEDLLDALVVLPDNDEEVDALAAQDRQALSAIRGVIRNLIEEEKLLGQSLLFYDTFLRHFERLVELSNFRRAERYADAVTICGADIAPNRSYAQVFVAGLIEGEFPRRQTQSGFASREELARWEKIGLPLVNPRHHPGFEPALFLSLVGRAVNSVVLSYPRYDRAGEETIASNLLSEALRRLPPPAPAPPDSVALPAAPHRHDSLQEGPPDSPRCRARQGAKPCGAPTWLTTAARQQSASLTSGPQAGCEETRQQCLTLAPFYALERPVSARDALAGWLWQAPESEPPVVLAGHQAVAALWAGIAPRVAAGRARLAGNRMSVWNGYLVDLVTAGACRVRLPERWSVTRLNQYGRCPFQFWVSSVLRFDKRKEPEGGLDAKLRGETYHRALELFYRRLSAEDLSLRSADRSLCLDLMKEAAAAAISELEAKIQFTAGPLWQYEKEDIYFRLARFLDSEIERAGKDEQCFEPYKFELRFGDDEPEAYPVAIIDLPAGPIALKGVIDRLDLAADGKKLRIVDYKTGSTWISASDARDGVNVQVPVYALAVKDTLIPGSRVAEGLYLSVNSGQVIGRLEFDKPELSDLLERTKELIGSFVGRCRGGDFTVRPAKRALCASCDHKTVCRIGELAPEAEDDERSD